jgi:rare lipoprotein A
MKYSQVALASALAGIVSGCAMLPTGFSSRNTSNVEDLFTSDESVVATNQNKARRLNDNGLRIRKSERGNMKSYVVRGQRYHTMPESDGYSARGLASWYGPNFHGQVASNGETYDMYKMTAAHKTLPLPTYVRVTHIDNGKSVVVKINDRGPFSGDRLIDLSFAAALQLGMVNDGTAMVDIEALTAQEVAELSGPDNKLGVDFYTDETVVAAVAANSADLVTRAEGEPVVLTAAERQAALLESTSQSVQVPVEQPAEQAEQLVVADATEAGVTTTDDGGELLSLESIKAELAAADSESVDLAAAKPQPVAEEIKVAVNAEATTEVRKAAGLPVDLIDNASAGQPVSLSSIGAIQTAKPADQASVQVPVENANAEGEVVALPADSQQSGASEGAANNASGPGYYIQAGVFADVKDAEKVAVDVVLAVPLEEVHVKPLKDSDMYRITVGPIVAADHAAEVSGKLDDAGVDNFTVKVKSITQ